MEACKLIDFVSVLKPWLSEDYVRRAGVDDDGNFRLQLSDGGVKSYRIEDCSKEQVKEVVAMLRRNGIPVEKI